MEKRQEKELWSLSMAQACEICGKGPRTGNNVSHAHNITRRRWNVNLHVVRATFGGRNKRIRVCTQCIQTGKVIKPSARPAGAARQAQA